MNLIKLNEISKSVENFCEHFSINYFVKETHYEITLNNIVISLIPLLDFINDVNYLAFNQILVGVDILNDTKGLKYISTKDLNEIIKDDSYEKYDSFVKWATNKLFFLREDNKCVAKKNIKQQHNQKNSDNKNNLFNKYENYLNKKFDTKFDFNSKGKAFIDKGKSICIISLISKNYYKTSYNYWYSYHPYQKELCANYDNSYLLLAFKEEKEEDFLLIPIIYINEKLDILGFSPKIDKNGNTSKYWHIHLKRNGNELFIRIPNKGLKNISEYICLLDNDAKEAFKEFNNERNYEKSGTVIKVKGNVKVISKR